jgi:polygalacturonase
MKRTERESDLMLPAVFVGKPLAAVRSIAISVTLLLAATLITPLAASDFSATDYGARPGGEALCTEAIQKAIDAAAVDGGTVVFNPGVYLSGSIFVKSGVHLRLDKGVEIRAVQDDAAYLDTWRRVAGIEMSWPAALINVYKQSQVRISGEGVIDGQGAFWWEKFWGTDRKGGVLAEDTKGTLVGRADFAARRPCLIDVYDSSDIVLEGLTLKRSPFWTVHPCYSKNITIRGITIRNDIGGRGPSTDGIDIDSCSDVLVEKCDIECNDDALCLKSGRGADGYRVNRPTERVVIRDCTVLAGGGGIAFGSEAAGGFRNIEAYRLKFLKGVVYGICIKPGEYRGGMSENIDIHDIEMEGVPYPVYLYSWALTTARVPKDKDPALVPAYCRLLHEPVPAERRWPRFKNVKIARVKAINASKAFHVQCPSESPARDFLFEDIEIEAKKAGTIEHVADWTFVRTQVKTPDNVRITLTGATGVKGLDQ